MTEPTYVYATPEPADGARDIIAAMRQWCAEYGTMPHIREAVAAWEQWTEARSFDEHTAAATRLDAAMLALREVAT